VTEKANFAGYVHTYRAVYGIVFKTSAMMMLPQKSIPKVMLLIETSGAYARGLLEGIAEWNHEHGPWLFHFRPFGLTQLPPHSLRQWNGDGILVRIDNKAMEKAVLETGIPAIDLRGAVENPEIHFIGVDNYKIAEIAFGHLREAGFWNYAFCGYAPGLNRFDDERCAYFKKFVEEAGYECSVFPAKRIPTKGNRFENEHKAIAQWLETLPIPTGLMTCRDDRGLQILDAAMTIGRKVPEELAVVSVNNDPYFCNLSSPTMTSIDTNSKKIGYKAASMLSQMMAGKRNVPKFTLVSPGGIVKRTSTDALAIANREEAEILQFLKQQAIAGIRVKEITNSFDISRSTIERLVKKYFNRTPKEEMLRVQIEHAKSLLKRTTIPISAVASQSGFQSMTYFIATFKKVVGLSPAQFRKNPDVKSE
jgi:LacI family transcriptional regulator